MKTNTPEQIEERYLKAINTAGDRIPPAMLERWRAKLEAARAEIRGVPENTLFNNSEEDNCNG